MSTSLTMPLNAFSQSDATGFDTGFAQQRRSSGYRNNTQKQESGANRGQIRNSSELFAASSINLSQQYPANNDNNNNNNSGDGDGRPMIKRQKLDTQSEDDFDCQPLNIFNGLSNQNFGISNDNGGDGSNLFKGDNFSGVNGFGFQQQQQQQQLQQQQLQQQQLQQQQLQQQQLQQQQQGLSRDFSLGMDSPLPHEQSRIGTTHVAPGPNIRSNQMLMSTFRQNMAVQQMNFPKSHVQLTNKVTPFSDKILPRFNDDAQDEFLAHGLGTKQDQGKYSTHLNEGAQGSVRFRSHQAENWTEKYEELLDYRLKNGNCLVPNAYPDKSLPEWVKRQRYQYKLKRLGKHSTMSDDRIIALEKIGFVWNSHDAAWEERLKELKQYKGIFGDCNVPSNYESNPQLAVWVKRQRRQYKFLQKGELSTMTADRINKLLSIGFAWSGRKSAKA